MIAEANLPPQGYQHCFDLSAEQVGVWSERLRAVPGTFCRMCLAMDLLPASRLRSRARHRLLVFGVCK